MKILFVSNYFNHHQSALCDALEKQTDAFLFVSTGEMRQERKELGYGMERVPEYVAAFGYEGNHRKQVKKDIQNADVVIAGAAPEKMTLFRIYNEGLTFRYTERLLKRGLNEKKFFLQRIVMHWRNPQKKPLYLLCAGGYVAEDYRVFGLFKNKAYKWGYFPETRKYGSLEQLMSQKNRRKILWAGRLIKWKHPEYVLQVAKMLKADGYDFDIDIIGSGEMADYVRNLAEEYNITDSVHFLGSMQPEQVRSHMEKSGIFLATSDKQEGWGAVINEAMNSGCAVVASHAMGSVPYLIENEKNGLVFQSGNIDMLYEKIKDLLEHYEKQNELGRQAYETITTLWNAEVAAQRLVTLSEHILSGEKYPDLYENGPCSMAKLLKDDWM